MPALPGRRYALFPSAARGLVSNPIPAIFRRHSQPEHASARTRSLLLWAAAGWARSTGRGTRRSTETSRSRSCRSIWPQDPDALARFERADERGPGARPPRRRDVRCCRWSDTPHHSRIASHPEIARGSPLGPLVFPIRSRSEARTT